MSGRIAAGFTLGNRYVLLTQIAVGGMGEVWQARDSKDGSIVAAKVLKEELAGQGQFLSRFNVEARNAQKISHPGVAQTLDYGEDDGLAWLIMELVDGVPMTELLQDGATLEPDLLLSIMYQTANALDAVHSAGIVHRDIKPANILVRADGVAKLTDFGISFSPHQEQLTAVGMVMGTAQYLPPEQATGNPATPVGDLYALGIIAYEALAGKRPFTGSSQVDIAFAHVNQKVPPLPDSVPPELRALVMQLLEKDPAHRPASARDLARDLARVSHILRTGRSSEPEPGAKPAGRIPKSKKRALMRPWPLPGGAHKGAVRTSIAPLAEDSDEVDQLDGGTVSAPEQMPPEFAPQRTPEVHSARRYTITKDSLASAIEALGKWRPTKPPAWRPPDKNKGRSKGDRAGSTVLAEVAPRPRRYATHMGGASNLTYWICLAVFALIVFAIATVAFWNLIDSASAQVALALVTDLKGVSWPNLC
ncbi:kinase [Winkia neuii]|uniref:non-specific serine/threonine protein kinase n=1 Tax=Winkia neuii TaxID=33007 RepID=A0A2I1INA6_9ACTO|nr:serine/threonine-protein kinase [Winkia neuii]PKY72572.1 kinase [Winkia neuii]